MTDIIGETFNVLIEGDENKEVLTRIRRMTRHFQASFPRFS